MPDNETDSSEDDDDPDDPDDPNAPNAPIAHDDEDHDFLAGMVESMEPIQEDGENQDQGVY